MIEERDEDLTEDQLPEQEASPEPQPQPQPDPEIEAEARRHGWRPKSEFPRDPERWVDASRFMELPQTQVKVQRDQLRERDRELVRLRDEQGRTAAAVKTVLERQQADAEERHKGELARLRAEMRAAAETGDVTRFDQLVNRETQLKPPEPLRVQPQQQIPPEVADYLAAAPWTNDRDMVGAAIAAIDGNPMARGLPALKQMQWAERQLREFFPERFPQPRSEAPRVSRVDGGGLGGGASSSEGWDTLPAEAKRVGQEFFDMGVFGYDKGDPAKVAKARSEWARVFRQEQGARA